MDLNDYSEGKRSSFKIALIYFIFGFLWIIFSDRILAACVSNAETMMVIQTYKGWFYVLATAVLVYGLVARLEERLCQILSQLKRQKKELQSKNKELENIIYVSSHDLRSPLINIQGFSAQLTEDLQRLESLIVECPQDASKKDILRLLHDEIPNSMRFIKSSADKLGHLQEGLLDVCQLGYEPMTLQTVDMNKLLEEVLQSLKFQADQCRAKIMVSELPPCRADEPKLMQVFINLISNALKYRDPERPMEISITGSKTEKKAIYRIADNGIGIAPQYHGKVFKMFHQLDPACQGQGLGLTIVKRILDRMDGKIDLESEQGKGAVFTITLPAE